MKPVAAKMTASKLLRELRERVGADGEPERLRGRLPSRQSSSTSGVSIIGRNCTSA